MVIRRGVLLLPTTIDLLRGRVFLTLEIDVCQKICIRLLLLLDRGDHIFEWLRIG